MSSHGPILINASRRSLKMENYFSGFIATGTEKVRCGFGNGDCLLFDFGRRVFAAADGTERFPWASRELLVRYQHLLSAGPAVPGVDDLREYVKKIYSVQEYNHKTTFSSVCLDRNGDMLNLHIANGGDSMVMIINTETKAVVYQTVVDMNFAGRSIMEAAVQTISLTDDVYRVILATDGYADLIKELDRSVGGALQELLFSVPVHEVADRLLNELDMLNDGIEYDDVGFIIFNPFHLHDYCPMSIISGGTTSREEKLFNKSGIGDVPDEWHETGYWQENEEIIKTAGIGFYWDGNRS